MFDIMGFALPGKTREFGFDLCFENKMWFDMIRTRKVRDDATGRYVDFIGYTNNWGKVYTATQLLFPIPLREMQSNLSLVQNPGY